jgi:hypothetical protein
VRYQNNQISFRSILHFLMVVGSGLSVFKIKSNIPLIAFKKEMSLKEIKFSNFFQIIKDILEMNLE